MHPVLFTLDVLGRPLPIASYGVLLACAIAVGALGTLYSACSPRAGRAALETGAVISTLGVVLAGGFTGALALHSLAQLARTGTLAGLPGISVWGALLGGALALRFAAPRFGLAPEALFEAAVPWVALAQAIGRAGCFLGGCCFGELVHEGAAHGARVPVQLLEALCLLVLALFFSRAPRTTPAPRALLSPRADAFLAAYACLRLLLEPLRGDAIRGVFWGGRVSTAQLVALFVLLVLAVRYRARGRLRAPAALALVLGCAVLAAQPPNPARAERFAQLAQSRGPLARFASGTFVMGSDDAEIAYAAALCARHPQPGILCDATTFRDEQPARTVQLGAFSIDRTEVTNAAYQRCVERGACAPRRASAADPRHGQPEQPVVLVTAAEAEAYCAFVGGRLPTEAQWERAARSGSPRRFPWGQLWNDRLANHGPSVEGEEPVDGYRFLAPVLAMPDGATEEGLMHMAGNAWELTADRYDPEAYAHAMSVEPIGASSGELRVMRGGSYASPPHTLRVSQRAALPEREPRPDVGFRCAYAEGP